MDIAPTGQVIAFPRSAAPENRLRLAAVALEAALHAQREAVAQWRTALSALDGSTRRLQESLGGYVGRLEHLQGQVREAGDSARRLGAWADGVLADQRAK